MFSGGETNSSFQSSFRHKGVNLDLLEHLQAPPSLQHLEAPINLVTAWNTLQVNIWSKNRVVCFMTGGALTSVRTGLCRGCRAALRCRSLYCSCCFLTRWWCSRHLSGLRTPAPPCPTGRRRDSSSPADTDRGETKHTEELITWLFPPRKKKFYSCIWSWNNKPINCFF